MKFDTPAQTNPIDQLKVIGKPTDRIEGPLKTSGTAPYAYEHHDVAPNAAEMQQMVRWVAAYAHSSKAARASVDQLLREYRFKNFVQAMAFTQAVGELAEEYGHHPALLTEWGRVKVSWWTHKIHGLHENDVIMAAKTEQLFRNRFVA